MEKKSERLEVRLGHSEKRQFIEACGLQNDTPSGAIRRYIKGYVRRSDSDVLSSLWRGSLKRTLVPISIVTTITGFALVGLYVLFGILMEPNADEIFSFRDQNGDGQLGYSEHRIPPGLNGEPSGILRVLDLDSSGTISRKEFVPKGRMVFAVENVPTDENKAQLMTLVEFNFSKDRLQSGTYVGATINANGLDRLVIWPKNGGPTVMEGDVQIESGLEQMVFQSNIVTTYPDP